MAATLAGTKALLAGAQRHGPPPPVFQTPDASGSTGDGDSLPHPHPDPKVLLKEDQKKLRHDVDRLLQMVKDLKDESDNTPETDVLSLSLVKKAEDIEKLARQIKERIRAS